MKRWQSFLVKFLLKILIDNTTGAALIEIVVAHSKISTMISNSFFVKIDCVKLKGMV